MPETIRAKPLHPRIEELLEHLEETRAVLTMAVAAVPASLRAARPAPDRWSLGEIVDHVSKVETAFTRLLSKRVAQARERGDPGETDDSSILAGFDSKRATDRSRPFEAPPIVVPLEGATVEGGLVSLAATRAALRAALADASGVALGAIVHPHPMLGALNLYQWGIVLGWHDVRHAEQIREIAQGKPSG